MQFATPHLLLLLIPLASLCLLFWLHLRRVEKRLSEFVQESLLPRILKKSSSIYTQKRQLLFCSTAVSLLVLCLAQPQWGFTWKDRTSSGVDLVIAVDVSNSMLATDIKPTRLEQARREIIDLLGKLKGDRVGLVSFAGVAFTESPLTLDYSAFKLFLNSLNPDLLPVGGTNIEAALTESIRVLEQVSSNSRARAIVLITDGEEFDGNASGLFKRLKEMNVRLYVLGIGTVEGAPIPSSKGYKKSKDGSVIVSRLHPELLEKLAKDSGGVYVQSVVSDADVRELYDNGIRKQLQAKSLEWGSAKRWNEYFQAPLLLAIIMLLYCWAPGLPRRESGSSHLASLLVLIISSFVFFEPAYAQSLSSDQIARNEHPGVSKTGTDSQDTNSGVSQIDDPEELEELGADASRRFGNAEFESALGSFNAASQSAAADSRFLIGKAASLYRLGKFEDAAKTFIEAAEKSSFGKQKAEQLYNAANSLAQTEKYKEALELYAKALEISPDDQEILENRNYVKKLVQQQEEQKDDKNEKSDKQKDEQKNQEQNKDQQKNKDNKEGQNKEKDKDKNSNPDKNKDQEQNQDKDKGQDQKDKDKQNKDKENKNKEKENKDSEQPQDSKQGKQEEQNSEQKPKEGADDALEAKKEDLSSEEIMQLRSVQEQRGAQMEFRAKKAIEQLKRLKQDIPQKDW